MNNKVYFLTYILISLLTLNCVLAQENTTSNALYEFMTSAYWVWFWVLLVVAVVMGPMGIWGFKSLFSWINRNFIKPKQGYIFVRQFLPNDRVKQFYVRPTGSEIKLKNLSGVQVSIPIKLSKGWMLFDGNLPVIEIDSQMQQRSITSATTTTTSQESIGKATKGAYNLGKLMASGDILLELKNLIMIMLVVTIISLIVSGGLGYQNYTLLQKISKNMAPATNTTQQAETTVTTTTIPVGGGGGVNV